VDNLPHDSFVCSTRFPSAPQAKAFAGWADNVAWQKRMRVRVCQLATSVAFIAAFLAGLESYGDLE
jgi:hypothetical protein